MQINKIWYKNMKQPCTKNRCFNYKMSQTIYWCILKLKNTAISKKVAKLAQSIQKLE